MRLLIVGAGGLGIVIAGYLANSGVDVTLLVKREHEQQFHRHEVRLEGSVDLTAPVQVCSNPAQLGSFGFTLICVKARDSEPAFDAIAEAQIGTVVSLQNGVYKDDLLVRRFGKDRVLGGLTYIAGSLLQMGSARASNPGATFFGELDGGASDRAGALVAAFNAAGLPAESVPNIVTLEWYKLAIFLRTALVSALTRLDIATLAGDPSLRRVCASIAREVAAVADLEGQALPRESRGQFSLATAAKTGQGLKAREAEAWEFAAALADLGAALRRSDRSFYPSLAQDVMQGRPTELEATAGDVLARAGRHGLALPVLESCADLVRGIEAALRG